MQASPTPKYPVVRTKKKKAWNLFFIALPLMLLVVLFRYIPLFGWVLSFFEYRAGTPLFENQFVGLKYFKMLFENPDMYRVLKNTLIFAGISFMMLPLPMMLAVLLNEISNSHFRRVAQTLSTLPHFISWIIVYSIAFSLFGSEGLINSVRQFLGLRTSQLGILTDANAVYWCQGLLTLWKILGWEAIIYIAAVAG
ncbi:MAG: sugar ABC transporter permease, partial [Clostridia bacterium]